MSRSIDAAMAAFDTKFGKVFGDDKVEKGKAEPYEVISTGSLTVDDALRVGGFVVGRISMIWGAEGMGKTTMMTLAMAEAQKKYPNRYVSLIDMEQKWDWPYAIKLGLDPTRARVYKPDHSEDVADMLKQQAASGLFSMIVVDSVGGMVTKTEQEKEADESAMGKASQIITRMVKLSAVAARKNKVAVIIVNQVRANFASQKGGDLYSGPKALRHVTTCVLRLRRTSEAPYFAEVDGIEEKVGMQVAVYVERLNVAPEGRTAMINLFNQNSMLGTIGVDKADEAATFGVRCGLIQQTSAAWYLVDGQKINGRKALVQWLREHPEKVGAIRDATLAGVAHLVTHESDLPSDALAEVVDAV